MRGTGGRKSRAAAAAVQAGGHVVHRGVRFGREGANRRNVRESERGKDPSCQSNSDRNSTGD